MEHPKRLYPESIHALLHYFNQLSEETKRHFAPHPFDLDTISSICHGTYKNYKAFIIE
jgi:hypothetical protein